MKPKDLLKKDLSLEDYFELLFQFFPRYIDYYESDLGGFLSHKFFKGYYVYIILRIIVFLIYIISFSLFVFLDVSNIDFVFGIIGLISIWVFYYIDKVIHKKYKYTTSFFHSKRKILLIFHNKLNLLLNNTILSEKYNANKSELEMIKTESKKLRNRIENSIEIIQPSSYYLKKFALPTILFTPIVSFLISTIYNLIQDPIQFNEITLIRFFLGLVSLLILVYQNTNLIILIKKKRKTKEESIYLFHEGMIFMILEAIRLELRIVQFPKEEKLKVSLLSIMKKMSEKLEHESA